MDKRHTQEYRDKISLRLKGKKPNKIPLTLEQIILIDLTLKNDKSKIITQKLWGILQPLLGLKSVQAFSRRATEAKYPIKIGYDWCEYQWGIHPTKRPLQIRCIHCQKVYVSVPATLIHRKYRVEACISCYIKHHQRDDAWIENQKIKQKIAQHRPETLEKHRKNSINSWLLTRESRIIAAKKSFTPERIENLRQSMRKKWATDVDYRNRVNGKGVFKHCGKFKFELEHISYDSKLELAFLLRCAENNQNVKRAEFSIPYIDPRDSLEHDYYPDFILDDNIIVEIKGQRWIDVAPETFKVKIEALKEYCKIVGKEYQVILDAELKPFYKKATLYHEAQKKDAILIPG